MKNFTQYTTQKRTKPSFIYSYPKDSDSTPAIEVFDLYQVRLLAQSRFQVHIVYCSSSKKYYALKVYPYNKGKLHSYYKNEIRFIKELQHPNVIQLLDSVKIQSLIPQKFLENSPSSYILIELAPYGDLYSPIQKGQIPQDMVLARTFFSQIINGLEYLHQKGISHMDLKLSNILIGENFNLKIADFDSSYKYGDILLLGKGTVDYRSKEVIKGTCKDTKAADIFSLGIILYILVMQILPFVEDSQDDHRLNYDYFLSNIAEFWQFAEGLPESPSIDQDFKDLFQSMVKEDPDQRITIEEIKSSKWLTGPIYSQNETKEILKSKLKVIDIRHDASQNAIYS